MYAHQHRFEVVESQSPEGFEETIARMTSLIKRPLFALMWTGVGLAVVAGALYLGNELRKQRLASHTPYESYSHAGEDRMINGMEYGVGI